MILITDVENKTRLIQSSADLALRTGDNNFNESLDYDEIRFVIEGNLIEALPDHILVSILSLLNSKEAARTSILSHRWRHLWTFTSRLVFDDSMLISAIRQGKVTKSIQAERSSFINWVNNTLKFHQGATIGEFTICFDVDEPSCKPDIDGWITFAFGKRVQSLHLDFRSSWRYISRGSYTLTTQFLSNYTIKSLEVLRLLAVEVTGEVVEYILSACPLLQVLSIESSESLVGLKVSGPSLKLKSLEILFCSLEYIEISAANLMSFVYSGNELIAVATDVPRLIKASISGEYAPYIIRNICQFSGVLSQLETLLLDLTDEVFKRFPKFPKMRNLKHLELYLDGERAFSLLYCAKLVNASPKLRSFTLKVIDLDCSRRIYREVKEQEPKKPHRCLKLIEFVGFIGRAVDMELLLCLLGRAVALKKLVIDPCYDSYLEGRYEWKDPERLRSRAKQLQTRLPPAAELVIL